MPTNEILAPVYAKVKYVTPQYSKGHQLRLYFASGCSWSAGDEGDEANWRLKEGATDHGPVSTIVFNIFNRADALLPNPTTITSIELWHSIPNAPNVLDHLNTLPPDSVVGSATGVAAAYLMYVFAGALRPTFRLTFFDTPDAKPQKYPPTTPPESDNGTLFWYMLKSGIPFATQDGIRLTRSVSGNTGYNRRLARTYGRTVAP